MADSFTDIANSALIRIGVPVIGSIGEGSPIANLINLRIQPVIDLVLRKHPWNCAKKRVALAPASTPPEFDYTYAFPLPSDYLRALDVSSDPQGTDVMMGARPRYAIESGKILFDYAVLYFRYIYRITQAAQLDAECAEAIGIYLAYDLAQSFLHSETLTKQCYDEYKQALADARSTNAQEETKCLVMDHYERVRMCGP